MQTVVVTGARFQPALSLVAATAARPKPSVPKSRPSPARQQQRSAPRSRPTPRRSRATPVKKPIAKALGKSVAKTALKKLFGGMPMQILETANDAALGILKWNKRNFQNALNSRPKAQPASMPEAQPYARAQAQQSPALETVYVTSARPNPMPSLAALFVPAAGVASPRPNARPSPVRSPGSQPARSPTGRAPQPKRSAPSMQKGFSFLFDQQQSPVPKEDLEEDPCKVKRRRERKKCPARGYKNVCTNWRKVPCQ